MAVIIKIRNKFGLLISILIFVALGIFVLETALNSQSSLLKGHSNALGYIDGDEVNPRDFSMELDKQTNLFTMQNPKVAINDEEKFKLQDKTWDFIVDSTINQIEYDRLGIVISDAEYKDMFFGADPNPIVKQQFTNPQTGLFDPQYVVNLQNRIDNDKPKTPDEVKQSELMKAQWQGFQDEVVQSQMQGKFFSLISKAVYVPKWQAELSYNDRNDRASFRYVAIPYYTIPDSLVKVTDEDLQNYINANKEKYKQDEETRSIHFVVFKVVPSSIDTFNAQKEINTIYSKLEASPDDTNYLKENADNPDDPVYYSKARVQSARMRDTLFKVPIGSLIGPYFENDTNKIIKLIDRKSVSDSAKVQDIILAMADDESDSAKVYKKADSIYQLIKTGASSFDTMAVNFSDDKESGKKGGDIGWLKQGYVVKPLNTFLFFDSKAGDMKLIKLQDQTGRWAYHIVKNVETSPLDPGVKLAYISKRLDPSKNTVDSIYKRANDFSHKSYNDSLFRLTAKTQKIQIHQADNIKHNDYKVQDPALGVNRDVIKWAFNAKLGEISQVYTTSDDNYVVATLAAINPKGIQPLSSVKPEATVEVKKEKKAALVASKLAAACWLNTTLDDIASITGQQVKQAQNATIANPFYIQGIGMDNKLLGAVFALKPGNVSFPIAGDNGMYIVQIDSVETAKPVADYSMLKQQLAAQLTNYVYGINDAIKKTLKVEDDRYNFY